MLTGEGNLIDFKTTSAYSAISSSESGKPEWEQQLNVLDFLCRKNQNELTVGSKNIQVKDLSIVAVLRDWSINRVEKDDRYPKKQAMTIPIRKWTDQEQEDFIRERIKLHQDSETADKLPSVHFEHNVAMIEGKPLLLSTFDFIYDALRIKSSEENEFKWNEISN